MRNIHTTPEKTVFVRITRNEKNHFIEDVFMCKGTKLKQRFLRDRHWAKKNITNSLVVHLNKQRKMKKDAMYICLSGILKQQSNLLMSDSIRIWLRFLND